MNKLLLFFCIIIMSFCSCHIGGERIKGNGTMKTENRDVKGFNSIDVGGNMRVYLSQDSVSSVRVEADENLMQYIVVKVDGDQLVIEPKDGKNLQGSKDIKIYVAAPIWKDLEVSGASEISSETVLTGDKLDIDISGASRASLNINIPTITVQLSGASSLTAKGRAKDISLDVDGASHAKCFELLSEKADVDASGASSADVFASVSVKADASGASHINYKGVTSHSGSASGAGSITHAN